MSQIDATRVVPQKAIPYHYISICFQITLKALEERVLKFTAYDVDRNRRHQVIGHALYPLKEQSCEGDERVVIWRDLEKVVVEVSSALYILI